VIARAEALAVEESPLGPLMGALHQLDRDLCCTLLDSLRRDRSLAAFGREIILPLADLVGDQWANGRLSIAAEHLASEVVVPRLKSELAHAPQGGAPLLAACFPGERHEWGFLVTLIELQQRGWRVEYLGADLPFTEIADATWIVRPQVVAVSSADPANVLARIRELRALHRLLPPGVPVVVGGEGAELNRARLHRARFKVGLSELPPPVQPRPSRQGTAAG
jgi:methanogenic corrinoid protein MtbC1